MFRLILNVRKLIAGIGLIIVKMVPLGRQETAMTLRSPVFFVGKRMCFMMLVQRLMVPGEAIIVPETLNAARGQFKRENVQAIPEDALMTAILLHRPGVLAVVPTIAEAGALIATAWCLSRAAPVMIKGALKVLVMITSPIP